MNFVTVADQILSLLTIAGQILIIFLLIVFFVSRRSKKGIIISAFFERNTIVFAFIVAFLATFGSLFYSEIIEYEPCKLCWFQRVFMYPQVILFGIALWRKDRANVVDYSIALSLVGAVIAGFHYYLQVSSSSLIPCSVIGYSAACSQRLVMQFGYITIPMMALTIFVLIMALMVFQKFPRNFTNK